MPNYPKYDGEIRPRGNTRAELGITHFTESNIAALNKNAGDFLEEIGIDVGSGQDWTIPMTPNSYIPRMFIVGRDRNNHDRIQTFQSLGIKPGSPEFWRQVQLGNVFVYPAGKKDPVQLQADVYEDGTTQFHYSKPITQQTMPKSPVKQASVFKRFMNFISGRRLYKAEVEAWKNREADEDSLMKSLSDMAEEREKRVVPKNGKKSPEQEAADIKLQEVAAKKKQAEKEEQLEKAKVRLEHHDYHTGIMTSIYRPDPELRKEYPLFKKNQKDWGLYTQEHFDSLKKYSKEEIDINKIQPELFTAMSFSPTLPSLLLIA